MISLLNSPTHLKKLDQYYAISSRKRRWNTSQLMRTALTRYQINSIISLISALIFITSIFFVCLGFSFVFFSRFLRCKLGLLIEYFLFAALNILSKYLML